MISNHFISNHTQHCTCYGFNLLFYTLFEHEWHVTFSTRNSDVADEPREGKLASENNL